MVEVSICSSSFHFPVGWKLKSHTRMKNCKVTFIHLQTLLTLEMRSDRHGQEDDLNSMAVKTLGAKFHHTFLISQCRSYVTELHHISSGYFYS
jgi:hypothetical protein